MEAVGPSPGRTPITVPMSDAQKNDQEIPGSQGGEKTGQESADGIHRLPFHHPVGRGRMPGGRGTFKKTRKTTRDMTGGHPRRQERELSTSAFSTQRSWISRRPKVEIRYPTSWSKTA